MIDGRIRRSDRVVFQPLDEGAGGVLLHLDTGAYRRLNRMGTVIWESLAEAPTRDELVADLQARVTNAPPTLADDVDGFLSALEERGLIATDAPPC